MRLKKFFVEKPCWISEKKLKCDSCEQEVPVLWEIERKDINVDFDLCDECVMANIEKVKLLSDVPKKDIRIRELHFFF